MTIVAIVVAVFLGWMLSNVVAVQTRYDLYLKLWSYWPQSEGQTDKDSHPVWARLLLRILL